MGMRNRVLVWLATSLLACAPAQLPRSTEPVDLVIATTTDVHGRLRAWDYYANRAEEVRGLSRAATIVDSVRAALFTEICTELACQEVQHIGNLLVLWRKKPAAPKATEHQLVPATRRQRSQPVTKGTAKPRNAPTKRQAMAAEGRNAAGRPLRNSLTKKNTGR